MTNTGPEHWHFGGRWYTTTLASDVQTRDGMGLELDDVAPAPGRGTVLDAFHDDTNGEITFTAHVTDPLPLELVEQFIAEARRRLPPVASWTDTGAVTHTRHVRAFNGTLNDVQFPSPEDPERAPVWENYVVAQAAQAALRLIPAYAHAIGVAVKPRQRDAGFAGSTQCADDG
jgi:hypothetical protein